MPPFFIGHVYALTCARPQFWSGFFIREMSEQISEQMNTLEDRVAAGVISNESHFIVSAMVRGVRGSRVVEIYMDGDKGIGVDDLARYSRELSFLLDTEDLIDGKYKLEVSSPGLDRPLIQLRQYGKHVDRKLKVKINTPEGNLVQEGVLTRVGDDALELTRANKEVVIIPFSDVIESKVVLPW